MNCRPCTHTVFALRPKNKRVPKSAADNHVLSEHDPSPEEEELWIACRACRQLLARPSDKTIANGSHQHTFANPSGVVFEIACYRSAQGCTLTGPPSTDFTWFAGHSWQITLCGACQTHLGWRFSSSAGIQFYGFIIDRVTEVFRTR